MTKNQLDYQRNYETRRHNLELEKETEFSNLSGRLSAQANLASAGAALTNAETNRRDAYTRRLAQRETERHNLIQEQYETSKAVTGGVQNIATALGSIASVVGTFG